MLAIASSKPSNRKTLTANLLPASIKHDGPIPFDARFWSPKPLEMTSLNTASTGDTTGAAASNGSINNDHNPDSGADAATSTSAPQSQIATQTQSQTQTQESYFRGRRLLGRSIAVPAGYEGLVLAKTENKVPAKPPTVEQLRRMEGDWDGVDGYDDDDDNGGGMGLEEELEVKLLEERGRFEEVVVWGHEALPEEGEDVYLRGLGEWVRFAEAIHAYKEPQTG